MIRTALSLSLAGLMLACAPAHMVTLSDAPPLALSNPTLALSRVTFVDNRPDQMCDPGIEDELYRQLKHELERRGYRVIPAGLPEPPRSFARDPVAKWTAAQLLDASPEQAAGVFFVRIDSYRQLDLCGDRNGGTISIKGKVILYARPDGTKLWEANGLGDDLGVDRRMVTFIVVSDFVSEVMRELPLAGK